MTTEETDPGPDANWRAVMVAFVVVLAGCPGGVSNTDGGAGADVTVSPSPTAADPISTTPTETVGRTDVRPLTERTLDEPFVVGRGSNRIRCTVTDVERSDRVGGEFGIAADAEFVVVNVTVTNLGDDITRVTGDAFVLVAADEKRYPTDGQAMNAAGGALLVRDLAPNATVGGVLVFDVPPTRGSLRLRVTAPPERERDRPAESPDSVASERRSTTS
jgi:hypothetical protein